MNANKFNAFLLVLCGSILFSCGGETNDATPVEDSDPAVVEDVVVMEDESDEPEFIIPSALQIHTIFKSSGLTYIDGVTNPPENTGNYFSKFEKLMNFGVYSADLFYCVLNDQPNQSIQYLKSIRTLADETGMSAIFNAGPIFERFESNISDVDSMLNIMLEFQENTDVLIAENNEEHSAMIIFTGAWMEGMYIGLDAARSSDNEVLRERLVEQMTILPNLVKGLELLPNRNNESDAVHAQLKSLQDYFDGIEGLKGEDEYSFNMTAMEDKHFLELYNRVKEIRNTIVKEGAQ
ncbi:hypothetical protein KFE98_18850 [bacterium SCSIO 12741]|nr:hypothetical protein KFE98_18850 [bacterium SCSIO 12741]